MDNILAFVVKIFPPFLDINLPIIVKYFDTRVFRVKKRISNV